ncbi:hypothetical protein [Spirosoma sp. KUDC1026]|nr:hypothetical protein [Spirosoma sp. KUDC1026]
MQASLNEYEQKMVAYATEAQRQSGANEVDMRHPDFSFQQLIR